MRPIETLLVLANLAIFLILVVPRIRAVRWAGYSTLITLPIAAAQVLVEGPRWQMVPAYALTVLLFLVWLLFYRTPADKHAGQKRTSRLASSLAIGLFGLLLAVSIALPVIFPVFSFPTPGGPYGIGTVTYHMIDTDRQEVFTTDPHAYRELMVQVWYPARKESSSLHAPYIQDSSAVATAEARLHNWPDFFLQHVKYVSTHALESGHIADDKPDYPVLVYLEGLTGYRQQNTFQIEELVSHGYIVAGIDQPGAAATVVFPDGHQTAMGEQSVPSVSHMQVLIDQSLSPAESAPQLNGRALKDGIIPYFAEDVGFTLDQLASLNKSDPKGILTGKLDLEHAGLFGMSLGGMVGAEACSKDPRIKACLIEDVALTADVVQKGLQQPGMLITRPADTMRLERQRAGGWAEKDISQTLTTMRAVYDSLPGDGYFVQVPGMFHIDLTDLSYLSPISPAIGFSGPIGAQRAHDIVNAYSIAFFDKHLRGVSTPLLNGPAKQFPEVLFEARTMTLSVPG
jgi:predicted dienelactone hydrolase